MLGEDGLQFLRQSDVNAALARGGDLFITTAETAELVKLRYFVGMTMQEAAAALGLAPRSAERLWTYARAWLHREIRSSR